MTPFDLQRAADALMTARAAVRRVAALPADAVPTTLAAAYRIQAELARRAGGQAGWKVGAVDPAARAALGIDRPTAARLLPHFHHAAPARLSHRRFLTPAVECELAFELGADLPARAAPYAPGEIMAAIAQMRLAIEVADSRLPPERSLAMNLADAMGNGAFVVGPPVRSWRSMDRGAIAVALRINGATVATGLGAKVLGDPLRAVTLLADHPPPGSPGLRRGEIVTTGSLTGMDPVAPGDRVMADFGILGIVELEFTP